MISREEEAVRAATVRSLALAERELSPALRALVETAAVHFEADAAAIGIVAERTVHLKGKLLPGSPPVLPRPIAFATAVLEAGDLLVIEDTQRDPRYRGLPWTVARFAAGRPLRAPNGDVFGAFVLLSFKPRSFDAKAAATFANFCEVAEALFAHQAIESILRPQGVAPKAPEDAALRARAEADALAVALGAPVPRDAAVHLEAERLAYEPALLRLILRKHAAEILATLLERAPLRFKDILAGIPGLNQRTLTTRLEELRAHGLVARRAYDEIPPRVEYHVPDESRELVRQLVRLMTPADATR